MKKKLIIMLCIVLIATFTMQSYAGTWRLNGSEWVNQEDFGEFNIGWYKEGIDDWYYFGDDGIMRTGWMGKYHLHEISDGSLGKMDYGWYFDGTNWYFLNTEHDGQFGAFVTGWQWIDGWCYYFNENGILLVNTITPDGYQVDLEGCWVLNGTTQFKLGKGISSIHTHKKETEEPSETEETKEPSETEETKEPSETEETKEPSETEETKEPSETEETKEPSETEETKEPSETEENNKNMDIYLGEDVDVDLDFEPKEPTPTFDFLDEEILNLIELNNDELPYIVCDDNNVPNYIDGLFSNKTILNVEDVIDALNDIHHIMKFENVYQEFKEVYSEQVDLEGKINFYRLQQTYHNIPVYGHQIVVSTNDLNKIQSLNGHYYPDLNIKIDPYLTAETAKEIIRDLKNETNLVSNGLYIYIQNEKKAILVWEIRSINSIYLISAEDGTIILEGNITDSSFSGTGMDMNGKTVSFPVGQSDIGFNLSDDIRNITIYDSALQDTEGNSIIESKNNFESWSKHGEAISAYTNMIKIYDYYANVLGRDGSNNDHKPIKISIRRCEDSEHKDCMNAKIWEYPDETKISIYHKGGLEKALDVLAHEYTHAVCRNVWIGLEGISDNFVGAINEAYADIIADLIEEGHIHLIGNFSDYGSLRDASKPTVSNMNEAIANFCNKPGNHNDHNCDKGNVHNNSTLITNVAYRIDQNWPEENHVDELVTLFYKSMYYLTPNSTFLDCRYAVLAAAKSMNMSDKKREVIATAFADVGIKHEDEEAWASAHHIIGVVKDARTDSPIIDAKIIAVATEGLGGGIGYSNGSGNYDVKVNRAVYKMAVYADGYKLYRMENVDLSSWFNMNYYMETIYLIPSMWEDTTQNVFASGKVINSLTGETLEGATIKFRSGSGNKTGAYIQTVKGLDIELVTDNLGQYFTAALTAGNYTMEVSKDGYITEYLNIVSGNSDTCRNQNISLTPELNIGNLRIVLTWESEPSDLDSHVVGILDNGEYFHTYYGNKLVYDDSIEICSLDVDMVQKQLHYILILLILIITILKNTLVWVLFQLLMHVLKFMREIHY